MESMTTDPVSLYKIVDQTDDQADAHEEKHV